MSFYPRTTRNVLANDTVARLTPGSAAFNLYPDAFPNPAHRGIILVVKNTAVVGGTTMTYGIYDFEADLGLETLLLASAALTVGQTARLVVYPGLLAVANAAANQPLGRWFKVKATPGAGVTSAQLYAAYTLVP